MGKKTVMMDMNRGCLGVWRVYHSMGELFLWVWSWGGSVLCCRILYKVCFTLRHGVARYDFNSCACWKYMVADIILKSCEML